MPKYYYVPNNLADEERKKPGSQIRYASSEGEGDNIFLWGQSVYIISQLLGETSFILILTVSNSIEHLSALIQDKYEIQVDSLFFNRD